MVSIIDYGMANLRSVQNAFAHEGVDAEIISTSEAVRAAGHLVLPGVGAFGDAATTLRATGLADAVTDHVNAGRPLLGICLGLQLLFDEGHEGGVWAGLGVLGGKCVRFDVDERLGLKVPHMGWNRLDAVKPSVLMEGLPADAHAYFVHGYHVEPTDVSIIATITDYGRPFVSSIARDNVVATQFHPEKSQAVGLRMLRNFAKMK